jgi:hypothetical protein
VLIQPAVEVPVTEYVEVTLGFTVNVPPVIEYVLAPLGEITAVMPLQMLAELVIMDGMAKTETVATAELCATHPAELVPITE